MSSAVSIKPVINQIVSAQVNHPYDTFGLNHCKDTGYFSLTTFMPNAEQVEVIERGTGKLICQLPRKNKAGVYHKKIRRKTPFDYQLKVTDNVQTRIIDNPYQLSPPLTDFDIHLLNQGCHLYPYKVLGAHQIEHHGFENLEQEAQ